MERRRPPYWMLVAFALLLTVPPGLSLALLLAAGAARAGLAAGRWARRRRPSRLDAAREGDGIALGRTPEGRPVRLSDAEVATHGLILGASGSGKSTTLLRILTEHIARGTPVVAVDLKGSPAFANTLAQAARAAGRPFQLWTPDGGEHWNPLAHGNATELKDKLIGTERFTEPHYKRAAERYLQLALQVLEHTTGTSTLDDVVRLMDPRRLAVQLRDAPRPLAREVQNYLAELTPDQLSAVRGLGTRLAVLTESHTGRFLAPAADGGGIDLRSALEGPEVVLFSLNSSRYSELAAQLGTMVIQDLAAASGTRLTGQHRQALVAVDEFSALGADHLGGLVARGRESGLGVLLVTQEFADLNRAAAGLRDQVIGNTTTKIVHRQDVPDSAFLVARMAGTERVWETTYQVERGWLGEAATGRGTRREVERFRVDPNRIATLRPGEAVAITKAPETRVQTVWVTPPRIVAPAPVDRESGRGARPLGLSRPAARPRASLRSPSRFHDEPRGSRWRSSGRAPRDTGGRELG